ncbi:uncharacterized protein N7518_003196 [Penicillium psychrosexuale]|uniref:uncharacterized protein n=1 Tax=Penicillium psychrosexuale TaxID=1002107 RepID=UPI0025458EB5|nr:uncharacterized protein N7518_003196 [Penicillium psychrosexuale]KAJ5801128.1 hypothetical protein N7518_003196 [Penicillium psychrosexuale]
MKSFAFALLASAAMALPANIPSGTIGSLPSGVPSSLPSGVIPSGMPLPMTSMIPSGSDVAATPSFSTLPDPTGAGQVLSILNQAGTSKIEMMAEFELESLMSKLPLSALEKPVGQVIQTAESVDKLDTNTGSGLTQITALLDNGNAALIELTQEVVDLLSSLGLHKVGSLLGSIVGGLESITGNVKRDDPLQNVLSITDVNGLAGGKNLLVQVEPTVVGLLSGLDLSTIEGPIGNVVAVAPSVSELKSKVPEIPGANFIAVNAEDEVSVLLIKVDGAVQGLLSTLGLGSVGTTVGSIVSSAKGGLVQ